jgi:hypothetical protein
MDNVKFITLTNDGYLDYTLNLIQSLERIGFPLSKLTCYCIGANSYRALLDCGINVERIDDLNAEQKVKYGGDNWGGVLKYKTYIIQENLKKHEYVCITDGDIVYERGDFLDHCLLMLQGQNLDLICQYDGKDPAVNMGDKRSICCGFMFIKSNEATLELFKYDDLATAAGWREQPYIRDRIRSLNINVDILDKFLFPNGYLYYNYTDSVKQPYLVHFNWVVGDRKKDKMISHKKWYLNGTRLFGAGDGPHRAAAMDSSIHVNVEEPL